jgi:hypothetical protein
MPMEDVVRKANMRYFTLLTVLAAIPCAGNEVVGSITLNVDVVDAYQPFSLCGANFMDCLPGTVNPQGSVPAGTYVFGGDVDGVQSAYVTAFGLDASNGDVIVGLNNGISAVGNPWPFSTPEATIASDLSGGTTADQAALLAFFDDNFSFWLDPSLANLSGGQLVEFSNGVAVGFISAAITPEPGSLGLSMLMLVGVLLARRLTVLKRRSL